MTDPDVVVQDYLTRLRYAAADLDPERRHELLAAIEEHIAAARSAGVASGEAGVRILLDRLGEPAEIVAAARDRDDRPGTATRPADHRPPRRGTGLELAALVMLTAGSFLPLVGWLAGAVLLWCSDRWRAGEKLLGTLVVPLGAGGVLMWGALLPFRGRAETCTTAPGAAIESFEPSFGDGSTVTTCTVSGPPEWVGLLLTATLALAALAVPVWLYRTARRRANAEREAAFAWQ